MIVDCKYLINVRDFMSVLLPRPCLKRTVFVTGWGEWLPLVEVSW